MTGGNVGRYRNRALSPTDQGQTFAKQALRRALLAALAGLFAVAGARFGYDWWTVGRFIETTDDAYVGGDVTPISPHVAGFVAEILVKDNDYVLAGQPLIRLDDRDFRAALDRANAIVAQRQATLASLEARARRSNPSSSRRRRTSTPKRPRRLSRHEDDAALSAPCRRPDTAPARTPNGPWR